MDMFRHANNFFLIFGFLFIYSCNKNNDPYSSYLKSNLTQINTMNYQINDSLLNWKSNNLVDYRSGSCSYSSNKVDTIICFNSTKDKIVTCILEKGCNIDKGDGIHFFYGAKIKDTWCFFNGAYIFLPREMYQKVVTKPLSFEKLHEIALKEVFSGYLKKKEPIVPFWKFWVKQEYEIDEQYFMKHWNYYGCMQKNNKDEYSQVCSNSMIDSLIMLNVYDNWRDKTERNFMNTKELWEYYYKTKFPL